MKTQIDQQLAQTVISDWKFVQVHLTAPLYTSKKCWLNGNQFTSWSMYMYLTISQHKTSVSVANSVDPDQMLHSVCLTGSKVIKLFSCSTRLSMKFVLLIDLKLLSTANYFLLNIAEHESFSADKYENANYSYLLTKKISCSAELSMKKMFYNLGPRICNVCSSLPGQNI